MSFSNATSKWSGYLYQGKVGIFVALIEIQKLMREGESLDGWTLEYESAEDFDIKLNGEVISRHQVKAYKDGKKVSAYKSVLDPGGFEIEDVDQDSRYLHTIVEVENYVQPNLTQNNEGNPNFIQLYQYPDGKLYCDTGEMIQEDITILLDKILKEQLSKNTDEKTVEILYFYMIDKVHKEVYKNHKLGYKHYPIIELSFFSELIKEYGTIVSNSIITYKNVLSENWEEYIIAKELNFVEYQELFESMLNIPDQEFTNMIINLNPDKNWEKKKDPMWRASNFIQADALNDILFNILSNTKEEFMHENLTFNNHDDYIISLINSNDISGVTKNMYTNKQLIKNIFQKHYLVNGQIKEEPLFPFKSLPEKFLDTLEEEEAKWVNENNILFIDRNKFYEKVGINYEHS